MATKQTIRNKNAKAEVTTKLEGEIRYLNLLLSDFLEDHKRGSSMPRMTLEYSSFKDLKENLVRFSRPYLIAELEKENLKALVPLKELIEKNKPHLDFLDISKFEGIIDTAAHKNLIKDLVDLEKERGWREIQEGSSYDDLRWQFLKDMGAAEDPPVIETTAKGNRTTRVFACDPDEFHDTIIDWLDATQFLASEYIYYVE